MEELCFVIAQSSDVVQTQIDINGKLKKISAMFSTACVFTFPLLVKIMQC